MNKLDKQYTDLLQDILDNGIKKQDRTGTGTISVFGRQIRHDMKDGFPLLTTKKMPFKTIVTELLWFLRGDTNIKYLVDNNCHIWDGDSFSNYLKKQSENFENTTPLNFLNNYKAKEEFINKIKTDDEFANKWGELGPIYGKQWRNLNSTKSRQRFFDKPIPYDRNVDNKDGIDQISRLIYELTNNPDSRRLMVNAWNVGELGQMVLPPCHYGFQVYTRELSFEEKMKYAPVKSMMHPDGTGLLFYDYDWEKAPTRAISLMWNQRSVDTFLGLPFNIASYGLLLEILAKEVNMVPDELIGNLGDVHLYSNHLDAAKEQIGREMTFDEFWDSLTPKQKGSMEKPYEGETYNGINSRIECMNIISEIHNISTRTREPFELPTLSMDYREGEYNKDLKGFVPDDFVLFNYQSHPTIKAPLSN